MTELLIPQTGTPTCPCVIFGKNKSLTNMSYLNNYYFTSFFWNTFQKILAAIVGFVSVPLLLGFYGKEQYGILSLATACNGYMHLLDLGMNVGAVRYFSLWRSQGDNDKINRVARTNITFYGIIAVINVLLLIGVAVWGESLFAVSHEQFLQLQTCLIIIASFSLLSWGATTFNQLLIADKQIAYTAQVQCVLTLLKLLLIWMALQFRMSLSLYFVIFTTIVSLVVVPYIYRCLKDKLINSIKPALYWKDFSVVLTFSLSIFALSLFQMTATQTRPIVLGIFSDNGATVNAEFRIVEVIPQFIIMISGTFASIFLPKTTELYSRGNQKDISKFAYKWTTMTTVIGNLLCFPFIVSAKDVLSAYVGTEYNYLQIWLIVWTFTTLLQTYSSPTYSLIMASGKTKVVVYTSAVSCIASIIINAILAPFYGMGSAVIGYLSYIVLNMLGYYFLYYSRVLNLSKLVIFFSLLKPTICAIFASIVVVILFSIINFPYYVCAERLAYVLSFGVRSLVWMIVYALLIFGLGIIKLRNKQLLTKFDELY